MSIDIDVKAIREELGLTKVELADKLGVERHSISRWEDKEGRPSKLAKRELNRLLVKHRSNSPLNNPL